jgi:hypothetical protein
VDRKENASLILRVCVCVCVCVSQIEARGTVYGFDRVDSYSSRLTAVVGGAENILLTFDIISARLDASVDKLLEAERVLEAFSAAFTTASTALDDSTKTTEMASTAPKNPTKTTEIIDLTE